MRTERRRHPRYSIMAHVRVKYGTINHILEVTNISLSGAFVSTVGLPSRVRFSVGQSLELNIFLTDVPENVRVLGHIVRTVEQKDPRARGFGVEFVEMDEKARIGVSLLVEIARSLVGPPPPLPEQNFNN